MIPFVTPRPPPPPPPTTYQPTTTKSLHFKPSILAFFAASPQKNIDGKNVHPVTFRPSNYSALLSYSYSSCFPDQVEDLPRLTEVLVSCQSCTLLILLKKHLMTQYNLTGTYFLLSM